MPEWGLLLAPGAGADRDHRALVAMDEAATAVGGIVRRMDFAYRRAGRRAPDRAPVLVEAVKTEAAALAAQSRLAPERIFAGGRSMGGRMCSMAVAEGLAAAGLVLVSYPLHAPGKPDRWRSEHFPQLSVPCLFVSGDRDTFATRAQLEEAAGAIAGPVEFHWVPGGDHGLRGKDGEVAAVVGQWLEAQAVS